MELNEYQNKATLTAIYPNRGNNLAYPILGLVGEAGEIANKYKKVLRDDDGIVKPEVMESLKKELGDVLWYIAQTASELKLTLNEIAQLNITRLNDRKERGVLQGSGDNR